MIEFDKLLGTHLVSWFPCTVTFRITLPFDEILELSSPTMTSVVDNALHFIFFFSINKVRWWLGKVGSVCCSFSI